MLLIIYVSTLVEKMLSAVTYCHRHSVIMI